MNEEKEIKTLLKKYRAIFKDKEALGRFKEPVLILLRRNGEIDIYEDVQKTEWNYEHSDETERIIYLRKNPYNFPYAGTTFKCYVCHEDYPYPLPHDPLITTEETQTTVDKLAHDFSKLLLEEIRAKGAGKVWMWVAIAAMVLIFFLYGMPAISDMMAKKAATEVVTQLHNTTSIISTIGGRPI